MTLHHGPKYSIEITNALALPGPGPSSQCSGEMKSAGAVATLHSWDAWLMPPPTPACCRLLQRRPGNEIPQNVDPFVSVSSYLAAWLSRKLLLVGCFKDLSRNFLDSSTAEASIMFQGCCSFSVRAATGCSACSGSGAAWIWMVFISHLKQERQDTSCALQPATTLTVSLYLYADETRRHSEIFC